MATEDNSRRLELPDRRKNTYESLELHLDERLDKMEARLARWLKGGLIAFGIIGFFCVVALFGFGYLLRHESSTSLRLCENQNTRHDNGTTVLMVGSNLDQQNAQTEAGKAEIRRRRDVSLGIIDMIAPKVDCKNPGTVKLIKPVVTAPPMPTPPPPPPKPAPTP